MLGRIAGRVHHVVLTRVSPLAVPVLLDIGRENVRTEGSDDALLEEAALVAEATGTAEPPPLRIHPVHRANFAPKRDINRRQGRLFG
jgi:ATP-dependent Lhr-like helicase